jgi:hypothetical protein
VRLEKKDARAALSARRAAGPPAMSQRSGGGGLGKEDVAATTTRQGARPQPQGSRPRALASPRASACARACWPGGATNGRPGAWAGVRRVAGVPDTRGYPPGAGMGKVFYPWVDSLEGKRR